MAMPGHDGPPAPAPPAPPQMVVPIVAIGASAGGLEAASRLFDALSAATGMAFIVVQHLAPAHKSLMAELLAEHTVMPVVEASDGCPLLPNHVYVIPPGRYLSVRGGNLRLSASDNQHGARLPFDYLLRSLAEACGPRTVGVILSGNGSDGSAGLAALKQAGGFAIAQSPDEADFSGMPRSAIDTGLVDRILPLADIPEVLADLAVRMGAPGRKAVAGEEAGLVRIVSLLKEQTGHDFRPYKPGTIGRRIGRRMGLLAIKPNDLAGYYDRLRQEPAECELLAKDLLINVTGFFRDPKLFETLENMIVPEIIQQLPAGQPLRIWVAGCSTGEEAYSIGMVCREAIATARRDIKLQIFASDLDSDAIATAREGLYPLDIAAVVSADRLGRFFSKDDAGYRVEPSLRANVVFTVQDVLSDPPFSRMELVSCRNLLIYLNAEAQAKVLALFHFALREGGTLVLGTSETIGKAEARFKPVARAECCYRQVPPSRPGEASLPLGFGDKLPVLAMAGAALPAGRQASLAELTGRTVLASHAPAAVLINRQHECLFSLGPTHRYLRVAPGYASLDLLAMAPPALRTRLRLAINRAGKAEPRVDGGRVRLSVDGTPIWLRIDVQCLAEGDEDLLLVCFVEEPDPVPDPALNRDAAAARKPADEARIAELERELKASQNQLQVVIEQQEIANQEQKAIHEEALSVNEEFQSTNEELLTSKEELQSLNEELIALNSQLQETLNRQRLASDDLRNVLYSTNVGTMFLDGDLKIRFFTPAITPLFNVIPGDIGRSLADLRSIADDPELLADAEQVLIEETAIDREVAAPDGIWFLRRIFPYRAHDSRIKGVVITFADITDRKSTMTALEASKRDAERANTAKSRFLAAASHDLRQPLQSLILLKELLELAVTGETAHGLLSRFEQTLRSMSGMLDGLLNINQIEAGVIEPNPVAFAVSDIFDRLRDEFTGMAQARKLSLHFLPSSAIVESDPRLLEQMIRNLLGNALKYTAKGKILLGCRRRGDTLRIEVWDTGIGIEAGQLNAIFEEFHQVGNAARESSLGLGLGLSIVQRLGRLLGHGIDVRSIPGRGSVFTVTVPCSVGDAGPQPEAGGAGRPENQPLHGCKIVVVEDDPDVLDLLTRLLQSQGYIVEGAADAAAAIRLVGEGAIQPELLLTDYNLPDDMNGLDLLARLRAMLKQPLPAIILTGDISTRAMARIALEDCVQLSKPVNRNELIDTIERLCPRGIALAARGAPAGAIRSEPVVYLIDDEEAIRSSLRELLEAHGRVVADFESAEAFLAAYRPDSEGCLLADAHMPGLSGIGLLGELRTRHDHLPVILITGDGDIGLAMAAMRGGACDFIEKPVGRIELLASIDRATSESHDIRAMDTAHADAVARVAKLTARGREIMDKVLAGQPSKNIAADLGISQRTVENHRAEIMRRMGVKSIPELARIVVAAEV